MKIVLVLFAACVVFSGLATWVYVQTQHERDNFGAGFVILALALFAVVCFGSGVFIYLNKAV